MVTGIHFLKIIIIVHLEWRCGVGWGLGFLYFGDIFSVTYLFLFFNYIDTEY